MVVVLLLLDEVTSALDAESKHLVGAAVSEARMRLACWQ
jgi:ABC-type iron transport system FetAB ATPase subunit